VLSVVLPAYNEAAFLADAVGTIRSRLAATGSAYELVVGENGSTDGTAAVLDDLARRFPEVRPVHLPAADYGAALRAGIRTATGGRIALFDVDYYSLEFLADALDRLDADPRTAVVVASKRGAESLDERPWHRRLITAVFGLVMGLLFGGGLPDTHGMKVLNRRLALPYAERCRLTKDLFDTELVLRLRRAGYDVAALPVEVREVRPPRSSVLRRVPRTLVGLLRLRVVLWQERGHVADVPAGPPPVEQP
jgi:glycosyltransferase involved in cell wall biosynthesis